MTKKKESFVKVDNFVFDEVLPKIKTLAAIKCYLLIIRKTIGWKKESDYISLSQFQKLTGMNRTNITNGCKELIGLGLIEVIKSKGTNLYKLKQYQNSTSTESVLVPNQYQSSTESVPFASTESVPTKDTIKNTIQKKDTSQSEITETPQLCAPKVARTSKIKQLIPCKEIADLYNEVLGDVLPQVQTLSESRKKLITKRWQQMLNSISAKGNVRYTDKASGLIWWRAVFGKVRMNDFWLGGSDGKWAASFDWIIKENNFIKILEWVPPVENRKKEQHG